MATLSYDKEITALLVIDPYNDFISEGGKVWDRQFHIETVKSHLCAKESSRDR